MNARHRTFLIVIFLFVNVFLILGYLFFREEALSNRLRKEVTHLSKLDLTQEDISKKIKTRGEYALVEEAIKEYMDDYADLLKDTLSVAQDSRFTKALSSENYVTDGPNFEESLSFLNHTKERVNQNLDKLVEKAEKESIKEFIHNKVYHDYYQELYEKLMLGETMTEDFSDTTEYLSEVRDYLNQKFDLLIQVLSFLKEHPDDWKVENGEIQFTNPEYYNLYNSYINQLQEK